MSAALHLAEQGVSQLCSFLLSNVCVSWYVGGCMVVWHGQSCLMVQHLTRGLCIKHSCVLIAILCVTRCLMAA